MVVLGHLSGCRNPAQRERHPGYGFFPTLRSGAMDVILGGECNRVWGIKQVEIRRRPNIGTIANPVAGLDDVCRKKLSREETFAWALR